MLTAVDEFEFWGRQSTEHALFLALGLETPELKAEWSARHDQLKDAYDTRNLRAFIGLLSRSIESKEVLLRRLYAGEWLGWIFPTFVDHVLREERYFLLKLEDRILPTVEVATWLRFMAEHAEFAAHLVDTTEREAMMQALKLASDLWQLEGACRMACGPQLATLSYMKGNELDAFFSGMRPARPKSVIHPVLAEHVVREGRRFLTVLERIPARRVQ